MKMINDAFYTGPANLWVFFLFIGCFICLGLAIREKIDSSSDKRKFKANTIAAAVLAFIAFCIILFNFS